MKGFFNVSFALLLLLGVTHGVTQADVHEADGDQVVNKCCQLRKKLMECLADHDRFEVALDNDESAVEGENWDVKEVMSLMWCALFFCALVLTVSMMFSLGFLLTIRYLLAMKSKKTISVRQKVRDFKHKGLEEKESTGRV